VYEEVPDSSFYLASAFIVAGLLIVILHREHNSA